MKYLGTILLLFIVTLPVSSFAQEPIARFPIISPGYTSVKVFDREGRYVGRILPEKRYWATIDRIPRFLQQAVVAVEDSRFYEHAGIDVRGVARALVKDLVKRRLAEGGSTITQQLVKNKYLSGEKTLERKLKEGRLALEMEQTYTKQQILEMYLNEIYYGHGAWGIVQAARVYFDKNPEELTDAESALLAGIPKNPGRYNPLGKPADVSRRRDIVLQRMVTLSLITPEYQKQLRGQRVTYALQNKTTSYLALVRSRLQAQFGVNAVEQGGLEVTAALDLNLQHSAEKALRNGLKRFSPKLQGALLSMDTATGDLLAVVGGKEDNYAFNRALSARRQPGSTVKPLLYAAALGQGITPDTLWDDEPVAYPKGGGETWEPRNYGDERQGQLTLRQSLAYSNNVIAVKLLATVGVEPFVDFARTLGLSFSPLSGLSLALGTDGVTLSELVQAYVPFATAGIKSEPRTIIRIYDRNRQLWTEFKPQLIPVIPPAVAYVTTSLLKDVMTYGTAKALKKFSQTWPSAGKTGTTDNYHDAWFVGYTPGITTGVWVGYDQPVSGGRGFTGGAIAAPIWEVFMRGALAERPVADFPLPETVVSCKVDSGADATTDASERSVEFFIAGTEPCAPQTGPVLTPVVPVAPDPVSPGESGVK